MRERADTRQAADRETAHRTARRCPEADELCHSPAEAAAERKRAELEQAEVASRAWMAYRYWEAAQILEAASEAEWTIVEPMEQASMGRSEAAVAIR